MQSGWVKYVELLLKYSFPAVHALQQLWVSGEGFLWQFEWQSAVSRVLWQGWTWEEPWQQGALQKTVAFNIFAPVKRAKWSTNKSIIVFLASLIIIFPKISCHCLPCKYKHTKRHVKRVFGSFEFWRSKYLAKEFYNWIKLNGPIFYLNFAPGIVARRWNPCV